MAPPSTQHCSWIYYNNIHRSQSHLLAEAFSHTVLSVIYVVILFMRIMRVVVRAHK